METEAPKDRTEHVRFTDLDGIRGILAVLVMLYHFGLNSVIVRASRGLVHAAPWGLCVDFFFILSGFVLCCSFSNKPPTIAGYVRKRTLRLLPVHIAILLLFLPVFIEHGLPDIPGILLNILLLQSMFGLVPINGPSWSASFELVMPGIILLLFPLLLRVPRAGLVLLLLCLTVADAYLAFLAGEVGNPAMARAAVGLMMGFCLFRLYGPMIRQSASSRATALTLCGLFATMAVIVASGFAIGLVVLFPVAAIATILIGARSSSFLSRQPFWWIGSCSYTIYMIHFPMLWTFQWIFGPRFEGSILLKAVAIAACLLGAGLLTRYVERPFIKMRFAPSPKPGSASA